MKRFLLICLFLSMVAACFASSSSYLACEEIFSRKEVRTPGHKVMSATGDNNYFRSVTATDDRKLVRDVKKLVEKDKKRASSVVEGYKNGKEYIILIIPYNRHDINLGFWWTEKGYIHLFVQSDVPLPN